jgi:ribonuclease HII
VLILICIAWGFEKVSAFECFTFAFFILPMLLPYFDEALLEAGCDEAGRGCLAGPVYAAAVILPTDFYHPLLNDSKQLSEKQRYALRPVIEQHAIAFAVASLCNKKIDQLNVLQASIKSMHAAIKKLAVSPQQLLIDGNYFKPYKKIPHRCIVQGDGLYASIAAASILAKTYRDDYMLQLHAKHPQYNWAQNRGYGTREHQQALNRYGPCRYHRSSFRLQYPEAVAETEKIL